MPAFARSRPIVPVLIVAFTAMIVSPATSNAAPPEFNTIVVDAEFVDEFWTATCGFAVTQRVEGAIKVSGTLNEAGQLLPAIERYQLTHTLLGPGGEITWQDRGVDLFLSFNPDGTVTLLATGVIERIVVPGEGLVRANIGALVEVIVFDPATGEHEGQVAAIWKAGPAPEDSDAADSVAVCDALSG